MEAEIFFDNEVPKDAIRVSKDNPWKLKKGKKVLIRSRSEFRQVARVELLLETVEDKDRDHIRSSKWTGDGGERVEFETISEPRYAWNIVCGSTKLQFTFFLTLVLIVSSYLSAALTKTGAFQFELTRGKWILLAVTIASALGAWAKDLW